MTTDTPPADSRFLDPAWTTNRYLSALHRTYLAATRTAERAVDALPMTPNDRRTARLLLRLVAEAAAPPNLLPTNPSALRKAVRTRGHSLRRGGAQLLDDIRHNGGLPSLVDRSAFTVGRDLATTPGRVVFRNHLMELIQYEPRTATVHSVPLLCSPPWINKYYLADITPDRSMVRWAIDHGHTVFMISYRNPDSSLRHIGYEDYLRDSLLASLTVIQDITDADEVNLFGACLGGLMALMFAAWWRDHDRPRLRSITALHTLADFGPLGDLVRTGGTGWILRGPGLRLAEGLTSLQGYLSDRVLDVFFRLLRSDELIWRQVRSRWLMGEPPPAYDVLYWTCDTLNVPRRAQRYLLRELLLDNAFANGTAELAGRRLSLDDVNQDTFFVSGRDDHIVPWELAYRTACRLPGDVHFHLSSGGHTTAVPPNCGASYWTGATNPLVEPAAWPATATRYDDTWWQPWMTWLAARAGPRTEPPPLGSPRHPAMEPAPGRYVHT